MNFPLDKPEEPTEVTKRLLRSSLAIPWQLVTLPWRALLFAVTFCTGLSANFLTFVGSPPITYADKLKLREAKRVIEHLHQREDGFRRKLKESQARLDDRSKEVRRLESKLTKVRQQIGNSGSQLIEPPPAKETIAGGVHLAMHFYFLVVGVLPIYWLLHQPAVPAVSRKFAWSLILPEGLIYFFSLVGSGPGSAHAIIQCCSLFLAGFVFCHWLHAQC